MQRATLLVDMDSVMVDLMSKWFGRYNEDYDDDLQVEQVTSWASHTFVKPECGMKIYGYLDEPGFYRDLRPLPHAIEVLERLCQQHDVYIVTSSPVNALVDKANWVNEHVPFIGSDRMVFTHHKHLVQGHLLFDDAPHNLLAWIDSGRAVVAMDYAYNKSVPCPRVSGWLEFESRLPELVGGERTDSGEGE